MIINLPVVPHMLYAPSVFARISMRKSWQKSMHTHTQRHIVSHGIT